MTMKSHDLASVRDVAIRGVPESTRIKLKLYADMRRVSIGDALGEIAEQHRSKVERDPLVVKMGKLAFEGARISMLASESDSEDAPDGLWMIRGVAEMTHRTIKVHAWGHGLTMAEGLEQMVDNYLTGGAADSLESITELP